MSETTVTITPHLTCRNANEAAEFYQRALGADLLHLMPGPDGKVMHATLSISGALFFICDEFPECGGLSPQAIGGTPVSMHVHVPDCDTAFARAVEHGCEVRMPLEDMFWGDRYGMVADPYGHLWSFATTVRQLTPEQMKEEMDKAMANCTAGAVPA